MSKRIGLYPGSFDPITFGHLDVLRQSLSIADEVIVAIGVHPGKVPMFSFEQREGMIKKAIAGWSDNASSRVSVVSFNNLVVETAQANLVQFMIRGLRDGSDLDYEMQLAGMNGAMVPEIPTIFLPASPDVRPITATLVRQIAKLNGDVSKFVPDFVVEMLAAKSNNK
jgi:pantetheine-phosphate adenylyltransferase